MFLQPCPRCRRHVRSGHSCPFCGTVMPLSGFGDAPLPDAGVNVAAVYGGPPLPLPNVAKVICGGLQTPDANNHCAYSAGRVLGTAVGGGVVAGAAIGYFIGSQHHRALGTVVGSLVGAIAGPIALVLFELESHPNELP